MPNAGRRTTKAHYDKAQSLLDGLRKLELKAKELGDPELQSIIAEARKALGKPNDLHTFSLELDRP
jgi:hypothetical protein